MHCVAESVKRYETGEYAIMNCSASLHDSNSQTTIIALGHNEKTQLYKCQLVREIVSANNEGDQQRSNGVINRKASSPQKSQECRLTFDITPFKSVQTDFK